jgi:hypothetical protein
MKKILFAAIISITFLHAKAQLTPFELSKDKNYTATYNELITYYEELAKH